MTVAVIDTGVDYSNPALGSGFGPGYKVIAGYDFADNSPDPTAVYSQHGTGTAGLIGSNDPSDLGVAPGVNIVALRVTDGSNTASLADIARALQWVIDNHQQYNITAVNMSLSDGANYAQNWFANDGGDGQNITNLIHQLYELNIPVIAAAGNNYNGQQGMGFAAIVSDTISVTATDLSGNLLPDAQRLSSAVGSVSATTVAAPGIGLTVPTGDSGSTTVQGTSFATALVTGSVTLLQDIYESRYGTLPTVAQLKTWLQQGATTIQNHVDGFTLGELNVFNSAKLIPSPVVSSAPPTPSVASSTTAPTSTTTQVASAPATPPSPAPVTSTTTTQVSSPPASSGSTPPETSVQVFVNGQEVTSTGSSTTSTGSISKIPNFETLILAMNSWGSGGWGNFAPGSVQVQIWSV
jgi:type VI secretion system secreted protein VgrG